MALIDNDMEYSQADWERERAICDKAKAYWEANATSGWPMSEELAAHPDYAACTNEMRERVKKGSLGAWGLP